MSTMAILVVIQLVSLLLISVFLLLIANHFSKFTFVNLRIVLPAILILAMVIVSISWLAQGGLVAYALLPVIVIVILLGVMKKTSAR
ncbi:hypothetical protein [Natribacillus halophilus]|uniref:Uncharacterized protein n=1 Tax=Natribacillus halophilus TaxID=549003 RepID=A0A1G8QCV6_9BACI|nr:hypothetical protein [Natribacillus halophilus]SDJ02537.1 hypothetical protein SAMN04488123_11183 [Natribacillus halophilus]